MRLSVYVPRDLWRKVESLNLGWTTSKTIQAALEELCKSKMFPDSDSWMKLLQEAGV